MVIGGKKHLPLWRGRWAHRQRCSQQSINIINTRRQEEEAKLSLDRLGNGRPDQPL